MFPMLRSRTPAIDSIAPIDRSMAGKLENKKKARAGKGVSRAANRKRSIVMEAGGERTAERRLEEAWKSLESALALQNKILFTSSSTTASGAGPEQRTKPSASSSKNTLARLVEGSLLPLTKLSNEVWRSVVGEAGGCSGGSAPAVTPETIRNRIINAASRKAYVQHTNSTVDEFEEDANSPWLRWELRCMRDLTSKSEREACVRLRKATKMAAKLYDIVNKAP